MEKTKLQQIIETSDLTSAELAGMLHEQNGISADFWFTALIRLQQTYTEVPQEGVTQYWLDDSEQVSKDWGMSLPQGWYQFYEEIAKYYSCDIIDLID